jgi:hypothetical protein
MNAVALDRQYRIERVANLIATTLQKQYPFITTEIVIDPPDGETDAWVVVQGARDADHNDEITNSTLDLTLEALEQDGVLVLAM